jgi:ADP-heptose:LPS heptosyltransferase
VTAPLEDTTAIRAALEAGTIRRLVVARMARIGDTLHVRPALELLRAALPDAFVVFLCSEYSHAVARGAACDELVPYRHKGRWPPDHLQRRRALQKLKAMGPFDLWLGLEDKPTGRKLARQLGCRFWHSTSDVGTHVVECKAGVLAGLGLWDPQSAPPAIAWTPATAPDVYRTLTELPRPRVGLQAGSHATKGWRAPRRRRDPTPEWLSDVATRLGKGLGGSVVIHAGSGGVEAKVAEEAASRLEDAGITSRVLSDLDLDALGVALGELDVFVTVNTGPAHMAAAVGTPVVLLEGPSPKDVARPWRVDERLRVINLGLDCSPCGGTAHGRKCTVPRCIDEIDPERVLTEVRELLSRG